jgi:hypothetical protein
MSPSASGSSPSIAFCPYCQEQLVRTPHNGGYWYDCTSCKQFWPTIQDRVKILREEVQAELELDAGFSHVAENSRKENAESGSVASTRQQENAGYSGVVEFPHERIARHCVTSASVKVYEEAFLSESERLARTRPFSSIASS